MSKRGSRHISHPIRLHTVLNCQKRFVFNGHNHELKNLIPERIFKRIVEEAQRRDPEFEKRILHNDPNYYDEPYDYYVYGSTAETTNTDDTTDMWYFGNRVRFR